MSPCFYFQTATSKVKIWILKNVLSFVHHYVVPNPYELKCHQYVTLKNVFHAWTACLLQCHWITAFVLVCDVSTRLFCFKVSRSTRQWLKDWLHRPLFCFPSLFAVASFDLLKLGLAPPLVHCRANMAAVLLSHNGCLSGGFPPHPLWSVRDNTACWLLHHCSDVSL